MPRRAGGRRLKDPMKKPAKDASQKELRAYARWVRKQLAVEYRPQVNGVMGADEARSAERCDQAYGRWREYEQPDPSTVCLPEASAWGGVGADGAYQKRKLGGEYE